jgi:hypothetical protein
MALLCFCGLREWLRKRKSERVEEDAEDEPLPALSRMSPDLVSSATGQELDEEVAQVAREVVATTRQLLTSEWAGREFPASPAATNDWTPVPSMLAASATPTRHAVVDQISRRASAQDLRAISNALTRATTPAPAKMRVPQTLPGHEDAPESATAEGTNVKDCDRGQKPAKNA